MPPTPEFAERKKEECYCMLSSPWVLSHLFITYINLYYCCSFVPAFPPSRTYKNKGRCRKMGGKERERGAAGAVLAVFFRRKKF